MPLAPLQPCNTPGCPALVTHGVRCIEHRRKNEREKGHAYKRGYDRTWERLRDKVRSEEPLCRRGLELGLVEPTEHIDHIIPIRDRPDLRLKRPNLQGLCKKHHGEKTARESGWTGR